MKEHVTEKKSEMIPPYKNFPVLTSANIILRELMPEDASEIVDISFYNGKPAADSNEALEMLLKINSDYQSGRTVHWAVADKSANKIFGTCGYYRGFENNAGELGCVLKSEFRGKGYMTESMKLAIDFGLTRIGLKKIFAITTKQNLKAVNLMERLGFIKISELDGDKLEYELVTRANTASNPLWEKII